MKGYLEKVPQRVGASWRYRKIDEEHKSYGWHRHDEFEIAIHRNFSGRCFVGHSETAVTHNQMLLLGPGLPHAVYSDKVDANQQCETHVLWFKKAWIEQIIDNCDELEPLRELLKQASQGIQFSAHTSQKVVSQLEAVLEQPPHRQLLTLLSVLSDLIEDINRQILSNPFTLDPDDQQSLSRVERAETYLQQHYAQNLTSSDLAKHLFISDSSVRRLFQKHYNESFSQRLKKIRLNVACDLLMNSNLPIAVIVDKVGYDNQSNFNRQFKAYKQVTPSQYRQATKTITQRSPNV